jgi:hypothetical protein
MTPEHETAQEVAEFLGLVYVPGMGAFDPDGRAVYMDDDKHLMTEEKEQETREWREQHRSAPSGLTREGIRSQSKLIWRDPLKIKRFAFYGSRSVQDTHLPRAVGGGRTLRLWEWKKARRDMDLVWRS